VVWVYVLTNPRDGIKDNRL